MKCYGIRYKYIESYKDCLLKNKICAILYEIEDHFNSIAEYNKEKRKSHFILIL